MSDFETDRSQLEGPNRDNYVELGPHLQWDDYFMLQAIMASFKSKDPNTKVGCVFVDQQNHQLSMGYNGFVAGIDEGQLPWGNDRTADYRHQKYGYVVHSEANAILHSKGTLRDSKLYVTLFPCEECAKMLATQKIREVVYLSDKYEGTEGNFISKKILTLADITYRQHRPDMDLAKKFEQHFHQLLSE